MDSQPMNQRGVTLVELMVAVALFGVLSVGFMTVFTENAKQVVKGQNEGRMSEDLAEFSNALELYLGNATQIISCSCGGNCIYTDTNAPDCTDPTQAATCSNPPGANPLLRFEYEDSNNPGQVASINSNCVVNQAAFLNTETPDGLVPRGCKRRMQLVYTQPVQASAANPNGVPGLLALQWEDLTTGNPAAPPQYAARLNGAYLVQCGQLPLDPTSNPVIPSPEHFRVKVKLKSRSNNLPAPYASPPSPYFEGWHPKDQGFFKGTHRQLVTDINFRNFDVQGVHFGKPQTFTSCIADGLPSTSGNCCSGYLDDQGICMKMSACLPFGSAAAVFSMCCSHKRMNGNCI